MPIIHLKHICSGQLYIYVYILIIIIIIIKAIQPFIGPWPLFSFLILYTVGMTPLTGISPS
jgi:hypothetical protein